MRQYIRYLFIIMLFIERRCLAALGVWTEVNNDIDARCGSGRGAELKLFTRSPEFDGLSHLR